MHVHPRNDSWAELVLANIYYFIDVSLKKGGFTIAYENMTGFFFSSSFDRFSRPLQLIIVLLYLHGTTLHVFRPKSVITSYACTSS
jgi:hypothetical protein